MIKIAIIGAGSIGYTRKLMRDILTVPELQDTLFHFHDIDKKYLDMMTKLARREIKINGVKAKIKATLDRRESVTNADYVINVARVGLLDAFRLDIDIPMKYGVDQCVGDHGIAPEHRSIGVPSRNDCTAAIAARLTARMSSHRIGAGSPLETAFANAFISALCPLS